MDENILNTKLSYEEIKQDDKDYFMPVFGDRLPIAVEKGEDYYIYDSNGKKYIDMMSGIATNCLGYSDKGFKQTLKDQIDKICHCSSLYYIEQQSKLAKTLSQAVGENYKCFFGNSGAEANECAIKLAKKYQGDKQHILTLRNSFHGRTLGTLAATGQEKFHKSFMPLCPTFIQFSTIDELKAKTTEHTGAVMIELIQGEGGVNPLEKNFVNQIDKFCKKNNLLLIVDEIQTGIGRTGKMFAFEHYNISPDIITLAKSLGNGIPIGACVAKSHIAFDKGDHGSTFGGNPFACAAANFVLSQIDHYMLKNIKEKSDHIFKRLAAYSPRGMGLLIGFNAGGVKNIDVVKKALEKGVLILTAGFNTVRLLPPYNITIEALDKAIDTIIEIMEELNESTEL